MPSKTCQTCGYSSLNTEQCPLIGYKYQQNEKDICPHWTRELVTCGRCNQIIPIRHYTLTYFSDGTYKPICENCLKLSGHCGGCSKSTTCDFETNPSPTPKAVQKRIQQGNQIMVATVKNPDRIRETCQKNCECFSEEFGCCRELNTCGNYKGAF
jgi:hypothetical protein